MPTDSNSAATTTAPTNSAAATTAPAASPFQRTQIAQPSQAYQATPPVQGTNPPAPAPTQTPAPTAPREEPAAKPTQTDAGASDVAKRLELLARQEQRLVEHRRQLKQREAELKAMDDRLKAARAEVEQFEQRRTAAKADPLKWLEMGGHSYETASQQVLNKGTPLPEEQIRALDGKVTSELERLKGEYEKALTTERTEREKLVKSMQEREAAEQRAIIDDFNRNVESYVETNADKYKLTVLYGQQSQVHQLIDAYYRQTFAQDQAKARIERRQPIGKILATDEAAKLVENYYQDLWQKGQKLLNPDGTPAATQTPGSPAVTPLQQTSTPGQRPSVDNAAVSTPAKPVNGQQWISEDERYKRALAALSAPNAVVQTRS